MEETFISLFQEAPTNLFDQQFFYPSGFSPRGATPRTHHTFANIPGTITMAPAHHLIPDAEWASDGSVGSRRCSDEFSEMSSKHGANGWQEHKGAWISARREFEDYAHISEKLTEEQYHALAAAHHHHHQLQMHNNAVAAAVNTSSLTKKTGSSKLFYCQEPGCNKTYTTTEGLRLHNRNIHVKDKKHKCTVDGCERAFVRGSDLKLHVLRIHEKERPFPCTQGNCTKSFACNSELTRHLNCHTRHRGARKKVKVTEGTAEF